MVDRAGVVGLGEMGAPIVRHWLDAGYEVAGFDVDEERVETVAEHGAAAADSPAAVAEHAQVTMIIVGTGDQVEAALFSEDGVAAGAAEGDVIVVSSTVHPRRAEEWAERLPDGVRLVDAPIARGNAIESAETTIFAGGDDEAMEQARPLLDEISEYLYHLGDVGTGQMGKTANNHLLWACHTANYDALRLAKAYGVDVDAFREGLKHSSGYNYALDRWEKASGKWAQDDLRIVFELAEECGVDLPQTERTRDAMEALEMEDIWALRDVDYRGASPSSDD